MVIAAFVALDVLCAEPYRCNRVEREAEFLLGPIDSAPASMVNAIRIRRVAEVVGLCLERQPHDVNLLLEHAVCDMLLGRTKEAVWHYEEALRFDRRPEIYLGLGLAQFRSGSRGEAVNNLGKAAAFAPYLVNYDSSLPWNGERMVDQVPGELAEPVMKAAERFTRRLLSR